jgi:endo-beta-N-acetylglucosaminidase D
MVKLYGKLKFFSLNITLMIANRYDSVVITGQLAWQDRLNSYNLPFFLSSTGLFSNYTVKQILIHPKQTN